MTIINHGPGSMRFIRPTSGEPRYEAIIEGACPTDGTQLERRDDSDVAWCPTCKLGWALRSDGPGESTLTLGFEFDTSKFDAALESVADAIERRSQVMSDSMQFWMK